MRLLRIILWILKRIINLGTWIFMWIPRTIKNIPKNLMKLPKRIRSIRFLSKIWSVIIKILNLAATGFSLFLTVEPIIEKFQSDTNK